MLQCLSTHDRSRSCQVLISTYGFSQLQLQIQVTQVRQVLTYDRSRLIMCSWLADQPWSPNLYVSLLGLVMRHAISGIAFLQGWLAWATPSWRCSLFEARMPTCTVGALKLLGNIWCDCGGSRKHGALICWGPIVPPMLNISTEFGANLSSRQGWAVTVCWVFDELSGWAMHVPMALASQAGALLHQALGSKSSLCAYSIYNLIMGPCNVNAFLVWTV